MLFGRLNFAPSLKVFSKVSSGKAYTNIQHFNTFVRLVKGLYMRSRGSSREVDPYSGKIEEIGQFSLNFEKQNQNSKQSGKECADLSPD